MTLICCRCVLANLALVVSVWCLSGGRSVPALVAECTCSVQSLTSRLKLLMEVARQQNLHWERERLGPPPFLSAEPALAGNLWHWDGSIGNHCSQGLPGRALSSSSGPSFEAKVLMLTHAEVVRSGKLWRSCVATHF